MTRPGKKRRALQRDGLALMLWKEARHQCLPHWSAFQPPEARVEDVRAESLPTLQPDGRIRVRGVESAEGRTFGNAVGRAVTAQFGELVTRLNGIYR